jgi:membrane-associated phospholipid phosphatase
MAARQGPPGSLAARHVPARAGYLLVGLLGWSRVAVRAHTTPQVVSGSVLGAAAAFLAYAAIVA